jgi:hypothetical protein
MIILIKSISLKVNKNFDIVLENPSENHIKLIGLLNNEEANKLKKFRVDKTKEISCIIDLVKPVLRRNILKYLITIKKIFKIMAIHEKNYGMINGFPDLKLIAKCLVDDGSFEAMLYCYDQTVVNLFRIDKLTLEVIH